MNKTMTKRTNINNERLNYEIHHSCATNQGRSSVAVRAISFHFTTYHHMRHVAAFPVLSAALLCSDPAHHHNPQQSELNPQSIWNGSCNDSSHDLFPSYGLPHKAHTHTVTPPTRSVPASTCRSQPGRHPARAYPIRQLLRNGRAPITGHRPLHHEGLDLVRVQLALGLPHEQHLIPLLGLLLGCQCLLDAGDDRAGDGVVLQQVQGLNQEVQLSSAECGQAGGQGVQLGGLVHLQEDKQATKAQVLGISSKRQISGMVAPWNMPH